MKLRICKLHPDAQVPTYAHGPDACFDLTAIEVSGGGDYLTSICRTGLAFEVPEGWAMLIFSRSSQGFRNDVRLANCVGVIDSGYTGEVMVKLTRDKPWPKDEMPRLLASAGDRIAQACLVAVPRVEFVVAEQLGLTERGSGGFGSTGQGGAACSPAYIEVSAEVRYWEDATINGEEDEGGTLTPFRKGNNWCPVIRLSDGVVLDWPEGMTADIHFKVCDEGEYWLLDENKTRIAKWGGFYVPDDFLCHGANGYGDYIIFKVGTDGQIEKYRTPEIEYTCDCSDVSGRSWTKLEGGAA